MILCVTKEKVMKNPQIGAVEQKVRRNSLIKQQKLGPFILTVAV